MESSGIGLSTWLILLGVVAYLFVLPAILLEVDRRRTRREAHGIRRRPTSADVP
jgi:hypothetical protein